MRPSWPTKKLGEIANYINGRAFKPTEWSESGLPIIRIQNLTETQEKFNHFNGKLEDKYLVKNGNILLSWSASLGVYIWVKGDAVLNQHIFKVVPHKDINKNYLFYALIIAVEELKRRVHGSTMTHVTKPVFNRVTTRVPPLAIQKQIVDRLDKIAKAQKLNAELIQKSDELFQSLLHQKIAMREKNWPLKDIQSMVDFSQLGLVRSKVKQNDNFGFNYIKMDNISLSGELLLNKVVRVNAVPSEVKKFKLNKGDFIFNTRNTPELVGKSTVFNLRTSGLYLFNNNILRIRFKNVLLAKFLNYYLHTRNGIKKLNTIKRGTTSVSAIYQSDLFSLRIKVPPLKTQKLIVEKLSAVQDYKKQLLEQKSKLKELFDSVLHKSMKGEM